jgi:MFS family permease
VAFLAIALAPPYPVAVGTMVIMGLAGGPPNPILMSIRQEQVPIASRARVFGTITAIALVAIPFGQLAGGYLSEWIGVRATIAAIAVIYLGVVVSFLFNPVLRDMDAGPEDARLPDWSPPAA